MAAAMDRIAPIMMGEIDELPPTVGVLNRVTATGAAMGVCAGARTGAVTGAATGTVSGVATRAVMRGATGAVTGGVTGAGEKNKNWALSHFCS